MLVQQYLEDNGLDKLVEEFKIVVTDYHDRVVLNYNQIESPRFNPICDECRALILEKGTWKVLARSFDRFYNFGEGEGWKDFPVSSSRVDEKLDGTLISVYYDQDEWSVATRKMAFAEGLTAFGINFRDLFDRAVENTNVMKWLETADKYITYVFELTSPMNRIVTPYEDTSVSLIAARHNVTGDELGTSYLDNIASGMKVNRPKKFTSDTIETLLEMASGLNAMDEGFVLVHEQDGSFRRMKCKNPKYVAIAHLRENGGLSPRRILALIMSNDYEEYLGYFPEDRSYFEFVKEIYDESVKNISDIWEQTKDIESQKDFALTIQGKVKYQYELGVLFKMRKKELSVLEVLKDTDPKKLSLSLSLKGKFAQKFGVNTEEE